MYTNKLIYTYNIQETTDMPVNTEQYRYLHVQTGLYMYTHNAVGEKTGECIWIHNPLYRGQVHEQVCIYIYT